MKELKIHFLEFMQFAKKSTFLVGLSSYIKYDSDGRLTTVERHNDNMGNKANPNFQSNQT